MPAAFTNRSDTQRPRGIEPVDQQLLAYAEKQAPRYTSYPTAPHFTPRIGAAQYAQWLSEISGDSPLSLYIHVPYCRQMCWYCGCNTYAARREDPLEGYVDTLLKEVTRVAESLGGGLVTSLHWGGGTPNILNPGQFSRIFGEVERRFDLRQLTHHAIELDPRFLDAAKVDAYANAGVNRASLGVQDFDPRVQASIGRVQSPSVVESAVQLLRAVGVKSINMDLMYGLPHQDVEGLRRSIELAHNMRPDRIALFGYAHVPWFKKRQRLIPEDALPGSQERFHQAESARAHLESLGYVPIGLDHFATPDDDLAQAATARRLRRSFQGYVAEDADVLIGIGPSAISTLPQGYAQNATEPGAWTAAIDGGHFATARGHALDTDDRLRRRFIEQIMCEFEAELRPLGGASACVRELKALSPMFADGLIFLSNERLVLKDRARSLCRVVAAAFDVYAHEGGAARHSRAV